MKNNKNFCLILILLSLMASPLMNAPLSQAAASAPKDNALTFLADVVRLDLSKYNVTLVSDRAPYNVANGVGQEEVRYKLENSKNILDATLLFKDNKLVWCTLYVLSGSPIYTQTPSTDYLDQVATILNKYQGYTGFFKLSRNESHVRHASNR